MVLILACINDLQDGRAALHTTDEYGFEDCIHFITRIGAAANIRQHLCGSLCCAASEVESR